MDGRTRVSGMADRQIEQNVQDLLFQRTGKVNRNGIKVPGKQFEFKSVAEFLQESPKWNKEKLAQNRAVGGSSRSHNDYTVSDTVTDRLPTGIKTRKTNEQDIEEKVKIRREISRFNEQFEK